jgi:uncharacterized protein with gpF-like domain
MSETEPSSASAPASASTSVNTVSPDVLDNIKKNIEKMTKIHQVKVLNILSKHACKLNENKSGVYVNMSFLPNDVVDELNDYIQYVSEQEESFNTAEYQKEEFKNSFFVEKEDKDNPTVLYSSINVSVK